MDALLLALLIGLALDQGDRSQRLVHAMDGRGAAPLCLIVIAAALACALLGRAAMPYLPGPAGLLFFAAALVLGGIGLLFSGRAAPAVTGRNRLALLLQLFLHRLSDRSAFLIVGVAAMTGNLGASALGGAIGGLAALLPPLLAGSAYRRAVPVRIVAPLLGAVLLLAGLATALGALGLL